MKNTFLDSIKSQSPKPYAGFRTIFFYQLLFIYTEFIGMAYVKENKEVNLLEQEGCVRDMSEKILNQYIIKNIIGEGMNSKVYLGYDQFNKRKVAIKELKDLQLAAHEADVMKLYGRSNFLSTFYDFFSKNGKGYIVMEYAKGKTFGENFDSNGQKKDKKLSVQITINILKGLIRLHRKTGFHHGDIKPKNVMIYKDRPETIKIIDFNCSKKIENIDLVMEDLQDAARMCIFLINGTVAEPIDKVKINDKKLESALLKAFNRNTKDSYGSLQEFINELKRFR